MTNLTQNTKPNPLKLRVILAGLGVNHEKFAKAAQIAPSHLSHILRGRYQRLTVLTRRKLADAVKSLVTENTII